MHGSRLAARCNPSPEFRPAMNDRSRNPIAALIASLFLFLCVIAAPLGHAAKTRQPSRESQRNMRARGDALRGAWRVKCADAIFRNGDPQGKVQENEESLVVVESDPDGSYQLYKFPRGFGEGLPRLRRVGPNRFAGEDTLRGINYLVKQTVELRDEAIAIRQTVFDATSNRMLSETTCAGSRSRSEAIPRSPSPALENCASGIESGQLPDRKVARRYSSAKPFSEGLAAAAIVPRGARARKWGFIDETGRVVIPMLYDVVTPFYGGLAAVGNFVGRGNNIKWGVVENLGPQVTPHLHYDAVKILGEGYAAVGYAVPGWPGLRWNLINRENTTVLYGFDSFGCFAGERAPASLTEAGALRTGYINKAGDFFVGK